uniref:Neur_chan_LBD domain-containing protein n=1 Tax=Onchocerca flexuosa TaxID=387005 RepID=A0A183HHD1_9BILA
LDNISVVYRNIKSPLGVNGKYRANFISLNELNLQDYTVAFYLRQFWRDNRLAFESAEERELTIGIDLIKSIWVPDTFFPNEKKSFFHEATTHNSFLRIDNRGNVFRSISLSNNNNNLVSHIKWKYQNNHLKTRNVAYQAEYQMLPEVEPIQMIYFPLDIQVCALEIEVHSLFPLFISTFDKQKMICSGPNLHFTFFYTHSIVTKFYLFYLL